MEQHGDRRGLMAAAGAYGLWGFFPLYFHLLNRSGALEIVAHRIFWSLVFCAIAIVLTGRWGEARVVLGQRRLTFSLLGAGVLVSLNWLLYIYAVIANQVVDAALGYFINPLVTVLIAMFFLGERVSLGQGIALLIGLAAVLTISLGLATVPWIGLGLALTFGFYSLAKNRIGAQASPFVGLGIEALALAPISAIYIVSLELTGQGTFTSIGWGYALLLAVAGLVTAAPLLLFAIGAARLPLITLAFIQYLTPVLQFLVGVVIFREAMPPVRWIGFGLVWLALVVLSVDSVRRLRHRSPQTTST
ncbi:MAG: EamA family transporter RarD [Propionibacteriaceae bacterium]|jgi:chloramphenicol-sensitive protein RarD|nr:EamA family transporter RarD [Propionibacteriaceae bacterium]